MSKRLHRKYVVPVVMVLTGLVVPLVALVPQSEAQVTEHAGHQEVDQKALQEQMREMQRRIAELEAALKQNHSAAATEHSSHIEHDHSSSHKSDSGKGMPAQNVGKKMDGMMKRTSGQSMSGMGMSGMGNMMKGMMGQNSMGQGNMSRGMMMMGKMKNMGSMTTLSSLPGFPGASHIYHIGADGFFLDHSDHIQLSADQQMSLNKLKEKTMLQQSDLDRQVESAEQELWVLTASDTPDAGQIEDKIREIAELQFEQRIDFIRAVGQAANFLSKEQIAELTGK